MESILILLLFMSIFRFLPVLKYMLAIESRQQSLSYENEYKTQVKTPLVHAVNTGYMHYLKLLKIQGGNFGLKIITYICRSKNLINSLVINKKI